MTWSLTGIRSEIANVLNVINSVSCYDFLPGSVDVPCIVVGLPETINYVVTFGNSGATAEIDLPLLILVSATDEQSGQETLLGLLDPQGETSIRQTLYTYEDSLTQVDDIYVSEVRNVGEISVAGITYLTAELVLKAITS